MTPEEQVARWTAAYPSEVYDNPDEFAARIRRNVHIKARNTTVINPDDYTYHDVPMLFPGTINPHFVPTPVGNGYPKMTK